MRGLRPAPVAVAFGRAVILLTVMLGVVGMHVLTGGSAGGGHGSVAQAGPAHAAASVHDGHDGQAAAPAVERASAMPAAVDGTGLGPVARASGGFPVGAHGAMTGCVLFLAAGVSALVLWLLAAALRPAVGWLIGVPGARLTNGRRPDPPLRLPPRSFLCVIRI